MRLITRTDIENWGVTAIAKTDIPILLSRLVKATSPKDTYVEFPAGTAAFVSGWDGIVKTSSASRYVPEGTSLWEIGTEKNVKNKADRDYTNRTNEPLGYNQKESTFVFVTPRFWRDKEKWCQTRLKEGIWKDVKVYDSRNLEEWLEEAEAVSRHFGSYINKVPFDGIVTIEQFWNEYSLGPLINISPDMLTVGREQEMALLLKFLSDEPAIKGIRATSKDEAVAFVIASAKQFEEQQKELFHSKSLVVENTCNFRSLQYQTNPLNLIAKFDERNILYAAVGHGHHVLVPLGPDDDFNQDTITLPSLDRDRQIESLKRQGLSDDDATKYSKEAARNITILKRLLKFPSGKWVLPKDINVREIIPALLMGRWEENSLGDREILSKLANEPFEDYMVKVQRWKDFEMAPFLKIGSTWRIASVLDAWTNLGSYLTRTDFEKFKQNVLYAFQNGNPEVELQPERPWASFLGKPKKYSGWAREGLLQNLIIIGFYGDELKLNLEESSQYWVDEIINSILTDANFEVWASLSHELTLVAEASPASFLKNVQLAIKKENSPILRLFEEKSGLISPSSNHTGLLWALEALAWMPEYFFDAIKILVELSVLDPGGTLGNRPFNSLVEIYKPWYYQTFADFEQRTQTLKILAEHYPLIISKLLLKLLPEHHDSSYPTAKMRWRMFDKNFRFNYTYGEIWDTHRFAINLFLEIFDYTEHSFKELLDKTVNLSDDDRRLVFDFSFENYSKLKKRDYSAWNELRNILSHHRSFPNAEWAFSEEELQPYVELYTKLEPDEIVPKYIWLFDENYPYFVEGTNEEEDIKYDKRQNQIAERRVEAIKHFIEELGLSQSLDLNLSIKETWAFGFAFANAVDETEILSVYQYLQEHSEANLYFVYGFSYGLSDRFSLAWVLNYYQKLKEAGFNISTLSKVLIPLTPSDKLWDFVDNEGLEIKRQYWENVSNIFYHVTSDERIRALNYLVKYKRYFTATYVAGHNAENIPTKLLVEILNKTAIDDAIEKTTFHEYEIGRIFKELDKRDDVPHDAFIQLEWYYLPILASHGTDRKPKNLHNELSKNPDFFIQVLAFLYKPKNDERLKNERKDLSEEMIQNRAHQAYQLLNSWKKVPGINEDGKLDGQFLKNWIDEVREKAKAIDRLEVAEMQIGNILAQYPETNDNYPPDIIADIIESINTESIRTNYRAALFNKRGSSTRAAFAGGDIERGHAAYFERLAALQKNKHPVISNIFSSLAKGYLLDAKRVDESVEREKLDF